MIVVKFDGHEALKSIAGLHNALAQDGKNLNGLQITYDGKFGWFYASKVSEDCINRLRILFRDKQVAAFVRRLHPTNPYSTSFVIEVADGDESAALEVQRELALLFDADGYDHLKQDAQR